MPPHKKPRLFVNPGGVKSHIFSNFLGLRPIILGCYTNIHKQYVPNIHTHDMQVIWIKNIEFWQNYSPIMAKNDV